MMRYPVPPLVAAMDVRAHHAVEASAGTGKTFLIERRVVDLIVRGGATIDQVLLVTFTEKATAELRRRVRALLRELTLLREDKAGPGEPAWLIDGAARRALRAALVGFDQSAISTIHGFCHRVLHDSAFDGARRFEETQVGTEAALRDALHDSLRDNLAGSEEHGVLLEAWLGQRRSVDQMAQRFGEILRLRGRIEQDYRPEEIDRRLGELVEVVDQAGVDGLREQLRRAGVHASTAKAIATRLGQLSGLAERRAARGLPVVLDELSKLGLELHEYLARFDIPALGELAGAAAGLADAAVPLVAALAARFLPVVRQRLERNKAERGQFDFGDMLEQVWRALEGPGGPTLAARLRARHPHALIDEFQDTDELQWSIFRRLYLESEGAAWLTVVGDPKQAIYGFRGADLATYLRAQQEIPGQPLRLETSYRSSEGLLRALDGMLGGAPFFSGGIEYRPLVPGKPGVAEAAPLTLFDLGGLAGEARRDALAGRISREIARHIAGGLAPESCFVLTRTTQESRDMAARLRADGVRCALYQQEGLLQTAEAAEVRDLFAAIAAPRDRSARLRAWQTRFFAVPLAGLEGLAEAGDAHPLVAPFYQWREMADRLDYERLLPRILADTRLCEREIVLAPGERALTNFLHLFEIVLDEMLAARCGVGELVERMNRWIIDSEGSEERNVQRLESERDAVQIMTIHRAKGLEAEVVFLYGGDGAGRTGQVRVYHQDRERRLFVGGTAPAAIKAAIAAEERGETERLLYVALTRAARRLYLPCWTDPAAENGRRLADLVNARVQGWLAAGGEPGLVAVEAVAADEADRTPASAALAGWQPAPLIEPVPDPALSRALARQRGSVSTSYTALKRREEHVREEVEEIVHLHDHVHVHGERGREVGIFLHEVLEVIPMASAAEPDLAAWSALPDIDRAIRSAALRHDLDPDDAGWREMLWSSLRHPIATPVGLVPGVAAAGRHRREVDFVFPLCDQAGRERALIRGAIDLVFEHDGRVFWLDWKSDSLADYGPDAVTRHVQAEYGLQADIYSLALARMLGSEAEYEARFGGLVYLFLRGVATHVERPRYADLIALERELAAREVPG